MRANYLPAAGNETEVERTCRAACVMTDAEGYTSIAEGMDPSRVVEFVNRYFQALFEGVVRSSGHVVDVKGDGMLAVWTSADPDPTMRARVCRGCLQMVDASDRFGRSLPAGRLTTRIGVDFGPIALARVGAFARYEFRAVGDTVNTCSRLEQLNKLLGTRILVSRSFAEAVEGFVFRDLGHFLLRGKRAGLRVLELVAEAEQASPRQRQLCDAFATALAMLEGGRIGDALDEFSHLCVRFPGDGPSRFFRQRCLKLTESADRAHDAYDSFAALVQAPASAY